MCKKIVFIIIFLNFFCLINLQANASEKIISGTIYLPEKYPQPKQKIKIQLNIREKRFLGPQNERLYVYIPKGKRSVSYTFKMSVMNDDITYALSYISWEKGLMRSGFYSPNGIVPFRKGVNDYEGKEVFRFKLDEKKLENIDIQIPEDPNALSLSEMIVLAEEKGKKIIQEIIKPEMTDFEKELVIYEWISENVKYCNHDIAAQKMDSMDEIWNKIIGPILNGVAECSSFSEAFAFLMKEAGVESMLAWKPGHIWNMSKISGVWYTVDTTWNWAGYRWLNVPSKAYPFSSNNKNNPFSEKVFVLTEKEYPNRKLLARSDFIRIAGNIQLPSKMKAPAGGIEITLTESKSRKKSTFLIAEGQNSAFFMMAIPREKVKNGMQLMYQSKFSLLEPAGYYKKGSFAKKTQQADTIDYSELDIIDIQMNLIKK